MSEHPTASDGRITNQRRALSRPTTIPDGTTPAQAARYATTAMRHFILALFCVLQTPVLAQTTPSLPQPRQTQGSDFPTTSVSVRNWTNRLTAKDPKVRTTAEGTLVQGAPRSLPLLRRFLSGGNEDLQVVTLEIIRRIGPPAIPLLVELLRDEQVSVRRDD